MSIISKTAQPWPSGRLVDQTGSTNSFISAFIFTPLVGEISVWWSSCRLAVWFVWFTSVCPCSKACQSLSVSLMIRVVLYTDK
jgi:hypothetical protein